MTGQTYTTLTGAGPVLPELLAERELAAVNEYGTANYFSTCVGSGTSPWR